MISPVFKLLTLLSLFLFSIVGAAFDGIKIAKLKTSEIKGLLQDPEVVKAIETENAKKKSLSSIKDIDRKWINTFGVTGFALQILENPCSQYLRSIQTQRPYAVEIFVTDNQGALVCATAKTSDYWQGDEEKFTQAFAQGKGAEYIARPQFDESTQLFTLQVSIPIFDHQQGVIGTATIGLDLDRIEE